MSEASETNKALVLEYMDAFRTFDPARYERYLAENPTYMAGMNIRVIDGKIATQVEMLDFRVAADKFDLSALPQRG
jgi:hypothetical protein